MSTDAPRASKAPLVFSLLLIVIGTGWLLTARQLIPGVNWVWIGLLAALGIMPVIAWGFDKVTFVIGTILIITSIASLARQSGRLDLNIEVPSLVIAAGVVILAARILPIPNPAWIQGGGK